ncbi:MAG TPA: hypothetical protein VLV78_02290 [Thermoanaerobaculia bacterium]|nr:hypothetical protein [Thermoanaerobaculia bacterium]
MAFDPGIAWAFLVAREGSRVRIHYHPGQPHEAELATSGLAALL